MKKIIFAMTMALALTSMAGAVAQPRQKASMTVRVNDTTSASPQVTISMNHDTVQDEVEAYSDTTAVDSGQQTVVGGWPSVTITEDDFFDFLDRNDDKLTGLGFILLLTLILFVLAPVLILALLFYFIYKNRKQRLQFAQQAMQNGQAIPDEVVRPQALADPDLWAKGMRQVFLGAGLAVFLGLLVGKIGFGLGALVLCIGAGNLVIARKQQQRENIEIIDERDFN